MAVKMMSMNAIDKQFIDDNMLTDEDFHYDTEEFEVSYEDQNILQSFANDIQMLGVDILSGSNTQPVEQAAMCSDLNNLLKGYVGLNYEAESPSSPNSSVSSEVYSTDNEISVISIPEVSNDLELTTVLGDTPPHTPKGVIDFLPSSPISGEPIIVSINSLNGVTYAVPQNTQAVSNTMKYTIKNIQPKVEFNTKPIVHTTGNNNVLTSDEMKKLANGALQQMRSVTTAAIPVPKGLQNNKMLLNSLASKNSAKGSKTKNNSSLSTLEICAAALKRQERIIKNRESASLSRKRKKEYVEKLEDELNQLNAENSSLKEENCRLKLKISDLEKEVQKLKAVFSPKNVKKTFGLMVVICMLTLNLAPYSSVFEKSAIKPMKADSLEHRVGRTLLWNDGNSTDETKDSKVLSLKLRRIKEEELESSYIVDFDQSHNSSTCQHFINKTESLRLENDLLGWVERVEKKRKQTKNKKRKFNLDKALPHLATLSRRRTESNQDIWARRKNKNEILIYETPRKAYEDFFDAIHRRDDTFYFVSFSGDHLLLPAIANNKTLRPRMSFVMPAMTLNESVGESDDHISMMQIDCEVMDTKLVYIKESVIPEHLRQKQNQTAKEQPHNSSTFSAGRNTRRLQSTSKLLPQKSRTNG